MRLRDAVERLPADLHDIVSACLFVLTLVTREWIELVFGVEPDGGSGALEWGIAFAFLLAAVVLFLLARRDHRRALEARTAPARP